MKHKIILIAAICNLLFASIACKDNSQGEPLKESSKQYIKETLDYKTDYEGKRIAVDGYIFLNSSANQEGGTVELNLFARPKDDGIPLLDFKIGTGAGKNEVSIPTVGKGKIAGYKTTEFAVDVDKMTFTDNDGNVHPITQKVRLSGTVEYVPHMNGGFSHLPDPMNKGKELYSFTLEDVRLDAIK